MRTAEQVAWAAGLFEGEGCLNAYVRQSGKIQMQLCLGMTDRDVVERFASIIGAGNLSGPRRQKAQWKPLHEWRLYEATKVRETIQLLMPYFGERRRARAEEVLALGINVRPHNLKATHCPQGHAYTGDNLILEVITRPNGTYTARRCRTCRRTQGRERMRLRAA